MLVHRGNILIGNCYNNFILRGENLFEEFGKILYTSHNVYFCVACAFLWQRIWVVHAFQI